LQFVQTRQFDEPLQAAIARPPSQQDGACSGLLRAGLSGDKGTAFVLQTKASRARHRGERIEGSRGRAWWLISGHR
jgi:hypothetical protein